MAVQVGQTLDKYELLERVGQGGMAIVYRGRDNSLRREVAVKVLHQHLAEHREARERFEREAHAVAKLRHENILEIYDFSGTDSDESYIVTEFIDGQSLKEFITDNTIRYPEVGAMITVQVCKALQHAHAQGILHRDVKPENVMIRNDGAVKLTDFGIAQMIDLQRLTVTGQLLGSPAYMSPEHVNGGQLDFRTDVFAIGIVLYQLITGELPFKGKNPHEILKRIAEGDYLDPSVVNPHVGKALRRIVRKAMAREKDDRFADVSMMLAALEGYLSDVGVGNVREELGRYFDSPVSYEMALRTRLIEHLTKTGKTLLDQEQPEALEAFNRVLTLDDGNAEVLAILDRLGDRKRRMRVFFGFGCVAIAVGLVWGTRAMIKRGEGPITADLDVPAIADFDFDAASSVVARAVDAGIPVAVTKDAAIIAVDAKRPVVAIDARPRIVKPDAKPVAAGNPDAGVPDVGQRTVTLSVFPFVNTSIRVGGGAWVKMSSATRSITVPPGVVKIEARNPCCQTSGTTVPASATTGRTFDVKLPFKPAVITTKCSEPDVRVTIDGLGKKLGAKVEVPINPSSITGTRVKVVFFKDKGSFFRERTVSVNPAESKVVSCD